MMKYMLNSWKFSVLKKSVLISSKAKVHVLTKKMVGLGIKLKIILTESVIFIPTYILCILLSYVHQNV